MRFSFAAVLLALGLAACSADSGWHPPGPLPPGCSLREEAAAPLRDHRNFMLVQVAINGTPATMVVDTGAEISTITPAAAASLALPAEIGGKPHVLHGVAGDVAAQRLRIGEIALHGTVLRTNLMVDSSRMPPFPGIEPPVAGLLGADVLSAYEVELNLPAQRLALYSATGCTGYTPWHDAVAIPVQRTRTGLIFADGLLEGRKVRTLLDSGARTTLVRRSTALTVGVSEAALAADQSVTGKGIGAGSINFRLHQFGEIGLPGDVMQGAIADVAELHLPGVEMLLGADYLGARHVWISYGTSRIFVRR